MGVQVDENDNIIEKHLNKNTPSMPEYTRLELLQEHGIEDKTLIYTYRLGIEEGDKDFDWTVETTEHGITEECRMIRRNRKRDGMFAGLRWRRHRLSLGLSGLSLVRKRGERGWRN